MRNYDDVIPQVMFVHKAPQQMIDKSLVLPEIRDTEWEAQDVASWHHFVPDLTIEDDHEDHRGVKLTVPNPPARSSRKSKKSAFGSGRTSSAGTLLEDENGKIQSPMRKPTMQSHINELLDHDDHDDQGAVSHIGSHLITVQVEVQRKYLVHMFRVVLVMMLISLSATAAMLPDDGSSAIERIGVLITLMLTAATYSQVIASSLPAVGYLTLLVSNEIRTIPFFIKKEE